MISYRGAKPPKDEPTDSDEQSQREDEVLKRMLNTPPKPRKPKKDKDND